VSVITNGEDDKRENANSVIENNAASEKIAMPELGAGAI
jgi:hypothetical protein